MTLNEVKNDTFREKGYLVVRNLFSRNETEKLRDRADDIGRNLGEYVKNDREVCERRRQANGIEILDASYSDRGAGAVENQQEVKITDRHARRGRHVYPLREYAVDPEEMKRLQDPAIHPFNGAGVSGVIRLADHDELYLSFLTHPNLVDSIRELLGPNVKMWHDHIFSKPPLNDCGAYHGANRYHQDGFLYFEPLHEEQETGGPGQLHNSLRSVTCWIALDEVTEDHGCLRYIPLSENYGQFDFDKLADGITPDHLSREELTPLEPGDAVFHDHWTIHGTGPNEARTMRRGWSLHFTDAESRYADVANHPDRPKKILKQTPDGTHFMNGNILGNLKFQLVCGCEFPGGI